MKEITESAEYTYRQLRLTKNDIRQMYSLIGEHHVREISIGNYVLETIDELETIENSILRGFSLDAVYANASPLTSSHTFISIWFMPNYARIRLSNSDNPEAFTVFHKIHTLLHSNDIGGGRSRYVRYMLDNIVFLCVTFIGGMLLGMPAKVFPANYVPIIRLLVIFMIIGVFIWSCWRKNKILRNTTIIYLKDKPPTFMEKHSDGLKLTAANTIIAGILGLACLGATGVVTGLIGYYKGVAVGEKQGTAVKQPSSPPTTVPTTKPSTAPATRPIK